MNINFHYSMVNVQKYWVLYRLDVVVIVVQSLSRVQLQPHGLQHAKASLSFTISRSLLKLMSIESVMPSNHLILCLPLLLLLSVFPNIRVFSNESALHIRWLKYWSFSFQWIFVQDWFPLVWDNIHQNFLVLNILFKVKWWVIIDGDFFFNIVSFLRNRHC